MQYRYAIKICNSLHIRNADMQSRYAIQICNTYMQYWYAIQICTTNICNKDVQYRHAPKDMQQRYAISEDPVMQLRFLDLPINARPQCLNASMPQCLNRIGGRRHEGAAREDIVRYSTIQSCYKPCKGGPFIYIKRRLVLCRLNCPRSTSHRAGPVFFRMSIICSYSPCNAVWRQVLRRCPAAAAAVACRDD